MENIYASSVAKSVFVWISIVLMAIGFIWSLIANKPKNPMSNLQNIPGIGTALNGIMSAATTATPGLGVATLIAKYGGLILFWVSWVLLVIYESFWNPHKHLKGVNNNEIEKLVKNK